MQMKLLNALPLNNKICRNYTKCSKPAFKEYILAHFFYREREFTSTYKKCKWLLASAAMYTRPSLLCSTLRNVTVERRLQKSIISSTRVLWCGVVTFYSKRVISIFFWGGEYGCSTCVTTRMVLWIGAVGNKRVTSKRGYQYQRLDGEACIFCCWQWCQDSR